MSQDTVKGWQVLTMLRPNGGWIISGDDYEGITFLECEPITKKQFEDGFAQYNAWKSQQDTAKESARQALLSRLGITQEEAQLLLGGN
jgi:hypothetical protein